MGRMGMLQTSFQDFRVQAQRLSHLLLSLLIHGLEFFMKSIKDIATIKSSEISRSLELKSLTE